MGGRSRVASTSTPPVPSIVPGVTNVSSGAMSDDEMVRNRFLESHRRRRGVIDTIRNVGGAEGLSAPQGKQKLGE